MRVEHAEAVILLRRVLAFAMRACVMRENTENKSPNQNPNLNLNPNTIYELKLNRTSQR